MRGLGLSSRRPHRACATTVSNPAHKVEPDRLARDFVANDPNERWVTDLTCVWTDEGWSYLAVILDLYSRAVVGWSLSSTLATSGVQSALAMAVRPVDPRLDCCITPIVAVSTRVTTTATRWPSTASR